MSVYVELGANDGMSEINIPKSFDENHKVILIEANPVVYDKCCTNRPNALVYNYACVSDTSKDFVEFCATLESDSKHSVKDHLATINPSSSRETISVPARTLQQVLDESEVNEVEFLSLDVEGAEAQVLRGINSDTVIERMLVEIHHPNSFALIKNPDSDEEVIAEAARLNMIVMQRRIVAPPSGNMTGRGREHIHFVRMKA